MKNQRIDLRSAGSQSLPSSHADSSAHSYLPISYIDEGLSGIPTKKRENFNRMIDEAAQNKCYLVITREFSRFTRNTLDEDSELRLSSIT